MSHPLYLHSMATPQTNAAGCLEVAAGLGLDGIELIIDDAYPSAVRPDTTAAELAGLRDRAESMGLRIAAVVPYDSNYAERPLKRAVDIAEALGAGHVRILAGTEEVQRLAPVVEHATAAGVSLNLENHMNTVAITAALTRVLADCVPGLGILYDQPNLTLLGAEPPEIAIALQQPLIRHVHVKNHVPTETGRRPVGLAHGVVDWRAVVRPLLRTGYAGGFTFEYERRWYPDELPPPEIGLLADRELLRTLLDEEGPE